MESSSIYIICPQCGETALLIERQGHYFCANCMFNYMDLKDDLGKSAEYGFNLRPENLGKNNGWSF